MTVRWTVRAATDRGPQAESRVLFGAPSLGDEMTPHTETLDFSRVSVIFMPKIYVCSL